MDEFPTLICNDCQNKITISYSFKQQCIESEQKLKGTIEPDVAVPSESFEDFPDEEVTTESFEDFPDGEIEEIDIDIKPDVKIEAKAPQNGNNLKYVESNISLPTQEVRDEDIVINDPMIDCHHCEKSFKTQKALDVHIGLSQLHPHECNRCCKQFDNQQMLVIHLKTHEADLTPCLCFVCGKGFQNKSSCKRHLEVSKIRFKGLEAGQAAHFLIFF